MDQLELLIGSLIDTSVDEPIPAVLGDAWLTAAVEAALGLAVPSDEAYQVSLLVTGDDVVQGLNRDYRGLDEVTDVLSFSASHSGSWEGDPGAPQSYPDGGNDDGAPPFVYPSGEPAPLGEVVISYPQAQRQAAQKGWPVDRELALLIAHGILHLAGHDHLDPQSEGEMQAKEQAALKLIPEVSLPGITPD